MQTRKQVQHKLLNINHGRNCGKKSTHVRLELCGRVIIPRIDLFQWFVITSKFERTKGDLLSRFYVIPGRLLYPYFYYHILQGLSILEETAF